MPKREGFDTYGLEQKPYDREADVCPCGCQSTTKHTLRLATVNGAHVAADLAKPLRDTFGLVTELDPALQAALEAADRRLAPFRTDALQNGG